MARFFVCLLILMSVGSSWAINNVKFKDCGSQEGTVHAVDVSPCTSQPCILKRGTNVTVTAHFTPKEPVEKVTAVVYGVIAGIPVPFPLHNPDGCKDSGLKCPLPSGKNQVYHSVIFVKDNYPSLTLIVRWELKDTKAKKVVCFDVPASIA